MGRLMLLEDLFDELNRVKDRYSWDPVAIEALEMVQWWAQEEMVETASSASLRPAGEVLP